MRIALLVLLLSAASAAQASWTPPTKAESAFAAAAAASFAVDVLYSMDIKNHAGVYESNPLSPWRHPSDLQLAGCAVLSASAAFALWYLLPSPARNVIPLSVLAFEATNIPRMHFIMGLRIQI